MGGLSTHALGYVPRIFIFGSPSYPLSTSTVMASIVCCPVLLNDYLTTPFFSFLVLNVGDLIYIDDGLISLKATKISGTEIETIVENSTFRFT